ncbi:Fe2+/Zn2+ uptake regulation protein [gamma proteobacterium HTCC5015]|nr:Fe2+/Zn2+ uptake regulation protein [gamma proteobacterium HTCC5015]
MVLPMNVEAYLKRADDLCRQRGARFTPLRRRVLELIASTDKPLGAYALLDLLKEDDAQAQRKAAPPTVYRALDFLLEHGLVHRIASYNTYIICDHPGHRHDGLFLLCSDCGAVSELEASTVTSAIHSAAQKRQFKIGESHLEITGLCAKCR